MLVQKRNLKVNVHNFQSVSYWKILIHSFLYNSTLYKKNLRLDTYFCYSRKNHKTKYIMFGKDLDMYRGFYWRIRYKLMDVLNVPLHYAMTLCIVKILLSL